MKRTAMAALLLTTPFLGGAEGGCGPAFSESAAPDMSGEWDVQYDNRIDVTIEIGGAVYTDELGAQGGTMSLNHDGRPLTFDLDCTSPAVVCPSEVWPAHVSVRQNDARYPHRVWLQTAQQQCMGTLTTPDSSECGTGTLNPDCEPVCDGSVSAAPAEAFGVIDEPGETFTFFLGAGIATNGVNCVLIGGSVAKGDLVTTGAAENGNWRAESTQGDVTTTYGGGCLWAGDTNMDAQLEALVLGAKVRFASGFAAARE